MMNLVGWISTTLLVISGVPFAWSTYRAGKTNMPFQGIVLTSLGMVGLFIYELGTSQKLPQLIDFAVTSACWLTVLRYKCFPRGTDMTLDEMRAACVDDWRRHMGSNYDWDARQELHWLKEYATAWDITEYYRTYIEEDKV